MSTDHGTVVFKDCYADATQAARGVGGGVATSNVSVLEAFEEPSEVLDQTREVIMNFHRQFLHLLASHSVKITRNEVRFLFIV